MPNVHRLSPGVHAKRAEGFSGVRAEMQFYTIFFPFAKCFIHGAGGDLFRQVSPQYSGHIPCAYAISIISAVISRAFTRPLRSRSIWLSLICASPLFKRYLIVAVMSFAFTSPSPFASPMIAYA